MHLRRDHEPARDRVEPRRQRHVAVVEHRRGVEQHLEDQHRERRHAERHDRRHLDRQREHDFERMEAHAGGHVDIEIGVVHAVQPPQHRHVMEDDMLEVDHQIERDHADQRSPPRPASRAWQTGPSRVRPRSGPRRPRWPAPAAAPPRCRSPGCRDCRASAASGRPSSGGAGRTIPTAPWRRKRRLRRRRGQRFRGWGTCAFPVNLCCGDPT